MADFIKIGGEEESLGCLAKNDVSLGISILNVSKVLLQAINDLDKEYKDLLQKIDKIIRKGYEGFGRYTKNKEFNYIEHIILEDFVERYNKLTINDNTLIVVCGEFVKVYFDKVREEKYETVYVSHSSRE